MKPTSSPSTVLLGEILGASGRMPQQPSAEVGTAVADEGADQHVDQQAVAVRRSRSSTACATVTPIQETPNIVTAIDSVT